MFMTKPECVPCSSCILSNHRNKHTPFKSCGSCLEELLQIKKRSNIQLLFMEERTEIVKPLYAQKYPQGTFS